MPFIFCSLVVLGMIAFCAHTITQSLRDGQFPGGFRPDRWESPISFWFSIVVMLVVMLGTIGFGVMALVDYLGSH
jgi:hypothetical protein